MKSISIRFSDIKARKEIAYPCFCGGLPEITVTGVPKSIKITNTTLTAGTGEETISFRISRTDDKTVVVAPETRADTLPKCMLCKSALLLLPVNDDDFILRLRVKCSDDGRDYERLMLILDLGNTRTCALTCTTVWDPGAQQQWKDFPLSFSRLQMRVNYKIDDEKCDGKPFSSKCVLGTNVHKDWTRSFIQLDKNAQISPRVRSTAPDCRWYLSGPKRYFWKYDTLRRADTYDKLERNTSKLLYLAPQKDVGHHETVPLSLPLAGAMSASALKQCPEGRNEALQNAFLPYSLFLKGMIWELMEQAELQANRSRPNDTKPFRLSDLVVTFPAVWTETERRLYEQQIRETADLYVQQRCFDKSSESKIDVDVSCDEGMAVFTTYLYSEYRKGNAPDLKDQKIAVIDIGGGTCDLVIAKVETRKYENRDTQYTVQAVYSNGTYEAGDKFIRTLVEKFLVPSVVKLLFPSADKKNYKQILSILADTVEKGSVFAQDALRSFVYSLWYPAALNLLERLDSQSKFGASDKLSLDNERQMSINELCDIITAHSDFNALNVIGERINLNETTGNVDLYLFNSALESINTATFQKEMIAAVEDIFAGTLKSFSQIIKKYDCSRVLFSGKISDIELVRQVFQRHLGKKIKLIGMKEYQYQDMPTRDFITDDSKFATVTGAGLYRMAQTGRLKEFDLKIKEPAPAEFIWGLYRDCRFYALSEIGPRAVIAEHKNSIYIARKSSNDTLWIPSYELRPNPLRNIVINSDVEIRFNETDMTIQWLKGSFTLEGKVYELQAGAPLTAELEAAFKDAFEFRVFKLMPEENSKSQAVSWLDSGMVFACSNNEETE